MPQHTPNQARMLHIQRPACRYSAGERWGGGIGAGGFEGQRTSSATLAEAVMIRFALL